MASTPFDPIRPESKKHSPQSIFMQCAAIPLFALVIYTLSKHVAASLAIIVLFYGNVFALWLVLMLIGQRRTFFDAVLVVNVSMILLALLLVSLSMGGFLEGWMSPEYWNRLLIGLCVFYFVAQSVFVCQGMKLGWIWALLATPLALVLNGAICYAVFTLFFNK